MSETEGSPIVQRLTDAEVGALERGATGVPEPKIDVGAAVAQPGSSTETHSLAGSRPRLKDRFLRRGKRKIRTRDSLKAVAFSSWLNVLLIFVPLSWVFHFVSKGKDGTAWATAPFFLSFIAMIPLVKLLDYGGEQMKFYLGPELGEFLVVTLNNSVEASLAVLLLTKCELKLLQSSIIGVVLLRLLLIPGVAFVNGGSRRLEQDLHPHLTELNHTLLTVGVMCLLLPAAFVSALSREVADTTTDSGSFTTSAANRENILAMSRGLAIILLSVYICSRIFLQKPPGGKNTNWAEHSPVSDVLNEQEHELETEEPQLNQWVCIGMLIATIVIMEVTAEWLVDSVEFVRDLFTEEWFGLILLPLVSFSGDAFIALVYFVRSSYRSLRGQSTTPDKHANSRPIDLSIQFILFWMPFIVLLGWWIDRPMSLLFDTFEVSLIISSCFIVNYVTADAKTNYAEGFAMLAFWFMIALCSWFYTGQVDIADFLSCGNVTDDILVLATGADES